MKKSLILVMVIALLSAVILGCSANTTSSGSASAAPAASSSAPAVSSESASSSQPSQEIPQPIEAITFKYGHNNTDDSSIGQAALKFKELVEKKSNGQMKVEVYGNAQLGNEEELIESLKAGIVDFGSFSTGMIAKVVPDYQIFTLPYIFKDVEQMHKVTDGELGKLLVKKALDTAKIKIFDSFWTDGVRYYFNNKRPVSKPEDMKGLKLRVPDQASYIKPTELLGATPVAMPFSEAYVGVTSGMIDGLETIAAQAVASNFNEVCKYMCLDGHIINPSVLAMNPARFEKLTDEQKAIIEEAAKETAVFQRGVAADLASKAIDTLKSRGMTITDVDKEAFKTAVKPAFVELSASIDPAMLKILEEATK